MSGQVGATGAEGAPGDQAAHREWLCALVDGGGIGSLLDVGCGDGAILRSVAARVPREGARFVGIDASATAIAAARSAGAGDDRITVYERRLGRALPFDDGMFDVVFSNNFLECVGDKGAFLHEVARVLRPGGQVVCAHWDWDSQTFDGADKELVRRVVHAFADWQQPWMEQCDGWMGRRLWATFQGAGWFEGTIHARVLTNTIYAPPWYGHARLADCAALVEEGFISCDDYRRLIEDVERQAAAGRYFYSITCYAYVGRRKAAAAG